MLVSHFVYALVLSRGIRLVFEAICEDLAMGYGATRRCQLRKLLLSPGVDHGLIGDMYLHTNVSYNAWDKNHLTR